MSGFVSQITPADEQRFWKKVAIKDPDDCWMWVGWDANDYGKSYLNGRRVKAHRFAFGIANGKKMPASSTVVRHTCDTPGCCNPRHLVSGTQADNIADRDSRRRHWAHALTHCKRGHPLDGRQANGRRLCLTCDAARAARSAQARKTRRLAAIDAWHDEQVDL